MSRCCPVCSVAGDGTHLLTTRGTAVHACSGCGLEFVHPLPEAAALEALYQADYYAAWGGDAWESVVRKQKKAYFRPHLERIQRIFPQKGCLLDVGAARGEWVELLLSEGWKATGLERSADAVQAAQPYVGPGTMLHATLEESLLPPASFHVITLFDLLEHVPHPGAALDQLHDLLTPGGLLYLVTPDADSFSRRWMGSQWWHFKREHLYYFTPELLTRLLEQKGFRILDGGHNWKTLSLAYLLRQLTAFEIRWLSGMTGVAARLLPRFIQSLRLTLPSGEFFLLAIKHPAAGSGSGCSAEPSHLSADREQPSIGPV
ncbi:MAG: class I SAM-dependent methyltransferase [Magnetococcales bacterium]|nr:class I SAM-dependent methyltransferase [Magnetococcales bacterium]